MDFLEIMRRRYGLAGHNQINIKPMVDSSIEAFEKGDIASLQNELFQLVSNFNKPGSGRLITGFAEKDRLGECFTLCLQYDWMNDSDIREVWAENGFYCIVDYLLTHWSNKQDLVAASLDLFLLLHHGKDSLETKFNDILYKAHVLGNPVFSGEDYLHDAEYLIREFQFFAATILSPVAKVHNIFSPGVRPAFERAKTDFEFASVSPVEIMEKMKFIASVIESILNDM